MASSEFDRQRIAHFRKRWADENFQSNYSPSEHGQTPTPDDQSAHRDYNADLSEMKAVQPARPESSQKKRQKRSWRENLMRASPSRLADVGAPLPTTSTTASSIRTGPYSSTTPNGHIHGAERDGFQGQDEDSETPQQSPKPENKKSDTPSWLTDLYILAWLTFFALLGTLARLGVEAITEYPDAPVTSRVLWANLGGSLIMGFLVEDRNLFGLPAEAQPSPSDKDGKKEGPDEKQLSSTHLKHKKTIPLYVGLTTGFCGCFTSFSSFIRDVFLALTNDLVRPSSTSPYHAPAAPPYPRNGGFSFLAACAILILHPAISLAALKTGAHLALLTRSLLTPKTSAPSSSSSFTLLGPSILNILNYLIIPLGFGSWLLGALFLTIFTPSSGPSPVNWRARATVPLLFAPLGCFLRYYLAKYLNRPSTPNFPWGTFVANMFGTLVLGMAWDLQHAVGIGAGATGSGNACAVLLGIEEGFCGCLTTVSTWVLELSGLGRKWAWWYGSTSVAVGTMIMIIVMGSMGWTIGFASPLCG